MRAGTSTGPPAMSARFLVRLGPPDRQQGTSAGGFSQAQD